MKDLYRDETNKDVYADDCCMKPSASYSDEYVHWLELKLRQYNFIDSLQEHKQVIRDLMETYIINLDENGSPKASITDIMKLIDRAVKLIGNVA